MPNEQWAPLTLARVTATPSDAQEGSVWYRTDTDEFQGSDGTEGPPLRLGGGSNVPVVRATGWHNIPAYGNAASINVPDGRLYALPFWPGRACTLTAVASNVTLALVGGALRMGVYRSDGVLPTTLLADYGTVGAALTGLRTINGMNTAIRPVLHYVVIGRQSAGLTLSVSSRSSWDPIVVDTSATIASNTNSYFYDSVNGALPASLPAPDGTDQGPCLVVQLS